nr:choice-of-anchor Q domain-containing protein [Candidatus Hydrogenedentota bacterium]
TVTNCTFSNNSASEGGAVSVMNTSSVGVFTNCIFWGDSATWYKEICNNSAPQPTVTFSCIDGGYAGTNNISDDPKFVDPDNDDYSLQGISPCINTGTDEGAPSEDILGNPRPAIYGYEMGAYEYMDKK